MTSSESINFSKYSIINEETNNISTDLEIVETKDTSQEKSKTELSDMLLPEEEKETKNESINNLSLAITQKNELSQPMDQAPQTTIHNLLYGNSIDTINPKFIGKSLAFLYDKYGDPKLTIGPDCKFKYINIF
jgi:hypothetical protein